MAKIALVHNLKKSKKGGFPDDYFSECDSCATIEAIISALRQGGSEVFAVEADERLLDWLKSNPVDIVFNIAEGFSGASREAQIPAILDFLNIPYTGSGVLPLTLSLNKAMAKQIFVYNDIPTPKFQLFEKEDKNSPLSFSHFPLIVKPNAEGSAKGIHASNVVENKNALYEKIAEIQRLYQQDVLVEEFIEGTELTVGILGNGQPKILPILEVDFTNCRNKGEFFYSWEVKEYQGIDSRYPDPEFFCPARLSRTLEEEVRIVALRAHQVLGCRDISRVDIRVSRDMVPYVLEVNPLPGLDPQESNFSKMIKACGMDYSELINEILENALKRYQKNTAATAVKMG